MRTFRWISPQRLPSRFDLRLRGWSLAGDHGKIDCIDLIDSLALDPGRPIRAARRGRSLVLDLPGSAERVRCLAQGFGDALSADAGLDEIEARAGRLLAPVWSAIRRHGRLELDPLVRDASIDGCRLRLLPREFAPLWRLSEEPGEGVSRAALLQDVLGLTIEPGTNALAVHICRLRKKLHAARLSHLLVTGTAGGSYALLFDPDAPQRFGRRNALDDAAFSSEDMPVLEEAAE